MPKTITHEITGREAVNRRDELEHFVTNNIPKLFAPVASATLTRLTGIAPTAQAGNPIFKPSTRREVLYVVVRYTIAFVLIFQSHLLLGIIGGILLVSAMRDNVSGVGHVLVHTSKNRYVQMAYDIFTAMIALASWDDYAKAHRYHHQDTAGKTDPDRKFLGALAIYPVSALRFLVGLVTPRVLSYFFVARLTAVLVRGPWWRRIVFVTWNASLISHASAAHLAVWYGFMIVGYQCCAITAWISLHHWWAPKPSSGIAREVAPAVTLGRLNLPEATFKGLLLLVVNAAVAGVLYAGAGEKNHDLHHGAWPRTLGAYCPYTRTQLLLDGVALRQTPSISHMFMAAFKSARENKTVIETPAPSHLTFWQL